MKKLITIIILILFTGVLSAQVSKPPINHRQGAAISNKIIYKNAPEQTGEPDNILIMHNDTIKKVAITHNADVATDFFAESLNVSGSATKTITIERNGLPDLTATFTDNSASGAADGNDYATGINVTGGETKTITLERGSLPDLTATFTDNSASGAADGNNYPTSVSVTGTSTKTITINRDGLSPITTTFTDESAAGGSVSEQYLPIQAAYSLSGSALTSSSSGNTTMQTYKIGRLATINTTLGLSSVTSISAGQYKELNVSITGINHTSVWETPLNISFRYAAADGSQEDNNEIIISKNDLKIDGTTITGKVLLFAPQGFALLPKSVIISGTYVSN